jgi:low affinity Fe/Cu permease
MCGSLLGADAEWAHPSTLIPDREEAIDMGQWFANFANRAATLAGHYVTFVIALAILIVWAVSGPLFGFSDTWQLFINTGTTIITFLMVFLIQNTQNRDAKAMQLKLDELIRSIETADDAIIRAEDETDEELAELKRQYEDLSREHTHLKSRLEPQDLAESNPATARS